MKHYFVAQIKIQNEQEYQKYLEKAGEIFRKHKGKYLVVDNQPVVLEGKWEFSRFVLIEFENKEDFNAWYNSTEYQEILKHRMNGADCQSILAEGKN